MARKKPNSFTKTDVLFLALAVISAAAAYRNTAHYGAPASWALVTAITTFLAVHQSLVHFRTAWRRSAQPADVAQQGSDR